MSESKEDTNNSDTVDEIWHSWSEKCRTELLQTSTSFHDIEQNLSSNLKKNWELAFYYKCKQCDGPTYASLEDLKFAHKACFEKVRIHFFKLLIAISSFSCCFSCLKRACFVK